MNRCHFGTVTKLELRGKTFEIKKLTLGEIVQFQDLYALSRLYSESGQEELWQSAARRAVDLAVPHNPELSTVELRAVLAEIRNLTLTGEGGGDEAESEWLTETIAELGGLLGYSKQQVLDLYQDEISPLLKHGRRLMIRNAQLIGLAVANPAAISEMLNEETNPIDWEEHRRLEELYLKPGGTNAAVK